MENGVMNAVKKKEKLVETIKLKEKFTERIFLVDSWRTAYRTHLLNIIILYITFNEQILKMTIND